MFLNKQLFIQIMNLFCSLCHNIAKFKKLLKFIFLFFRTKHLILADPWGFPERPLEVERKSSVPLWVRAIAFAVQPLNPLWAVRFVGPFGQWVIEKTRPDLIKKFSPILQEEDNLITQYIYQCNSQSPT